MWGFVSVMLTILVWTKFGLPHSPHAFGSMADRAIAAHSSLQPGAQKKIPSLSPYLAMVGCSSAIILSCGEI